MAMTQKEFIKEMTEIVEETNKEIEIIKVKANTRMKLLFDTYTKSQMGDSDEKDKI